MLTPFVVVGLLVASSLVGFVAMPTAGDQPLNKTEDLIQRVADQRGQVNTTTTHEQRETLTTGPV